MGPISVSGSPALLMKADRLGLPAVEKSLEKEDASANYHPTIIKSAEEPRFGSAFDHLDGSA